MAKTTKRTAVEERSKDVFAELGPNANGTNTKLRLCVAINKIMAHTNLTQVEAAKVLGVNQSKISALVHYRLDTFSVERLIHFATALKHDVVIEIRPRTRGKARVMIVEAA
jgi:predicted XRE-type DNA-binding protein